MDVLRYARDRRMKDVSIEFDGLEEDSDDWDGIDYHDLDKFADKLLARAYKYLRKTFGRTNGNPEYNATLGLYKCHKIIIDEDDGVVKAYFRKIQPEESPHPLKNI
jgi:hypothetical protein